MFDIRWIRENPEAFDRGLQRRGNEPLSSQVLALDEKLRTSQTELQKLNEARNQASKEIGAAKQRGEDAAGQIAEVGRLKDVVRDAETASRASSAELDEMLAALPNLPADDVPEGLDESTNVEIRRVGVRPEFNFQPKEHFEIGEGLGLMDFEAAAKMSGARFVVLRGALSRLERALASFMLDLHSREHGFLEVKPPTLVREEALFGTGNLPKFGADLFRTEEGFWLIPTAEVPLTNLVRGEILEEAELPLRFTGYTPCFRSEAGAAGKDTRGMIRQHEFTKVEMVIIAHPEHSAEEHEHMTASAEEVLKRLGLHYRVVTLSCGDMGGAAQKTYDIEVWLPGQDTFREISSCSNCGDYQARRMSARFRPEGSKKGTRFVHTLNGSGLAVGRTLVALLENYQQADGSVLVPEALRPYLGQEMITANG
ncbi:MAG: serine--tRNA ligase [Rhodospirillaceae bacterium]|nr:serine--tRNA ligase [Rhodospirillaceae bacterium]|tara:strand:- start:2372 stop:3649 length:1278 start_codon:yes stop_codon:yes gene_type:complete